MPDTTRPVPPPLIHRAPDCTLCTKETHWDGDGLACEDCGVSWPHDASDEAGQWINPDAKQCRSQRYDVRCYLNENHPGNLHLHPNDFCGWTTPQETARAADEEESTNA